MAIVLSGYFYYYLYLLILIYHYTHTHTTTSPSTFLVFLARTQLRRSKAKEKKKINVWHDLRQACSSPRSQKGSFRRHYSLQVQACPDWWDRCLKWIKWDSCSCLDLDRAEAVKGSRPCVAAHCEWCDKVTKRASEATADACRLQSKNTCWNRFSYREQCITSSEERDQKHMLQSFCVFLGNVKEGRVSY